MIRAVLLFPVLLLSLYGLGEFIRWKFLGDAPFSIGRIGRALGFGILAHALLMTLLGFVYLLHPTVAAIATILPVIIFWKFWSRDIKSIFTRNTWKPATGLHVVEIIFLVLIIGLTLLRGFNALAPNISWDATSHHYLVPAVWLETGRVSDLPSVVFSYYPSLNEIGISGTMALGSDYLSNLYGWLFGILAIFLLIGICTRHSDLLLTKRENESRFNIGRFAGIAAALLFTLFPGVGVQTAGGYVDLPLACWVLLTIDLLLEFKASPKLPILIAAALLSGAALSTKHLALILFPGFLVILGWLLIFNNESKITTKSRWGLFLAFIAISILVPLPWYIRSAWFTGNPLYPFGIFGLPTPPHPPFTSASWVRPDFDRSILGFLTYWLHLSFSEKVAAALGRNYSLAFPVLIPLALLIPKLKNPGRLIAVLAGFSVLIIYALFPIETRYHLPFLAPIALVYGLLIAQWITSPPERITGLILILNLAIIAYYLIGVGIAHADYARWTVYIVFIIALFLVVERTQKSRHIVITILLLVLCIGSCAFDIRNEDIIELKKRYEVVLNLEPEDKYLSAMSPRNYGAIHHINTEMDWENMRILCLEPRLYRLKADWVTWFGLEEPTVPTTPAENVAIWYRGGFTHILLGDDVTLKALMYYNIVHKNGWDIPGASPDELIGYLQEHPEENKVYFLQQELWYNIAGEQMVSRRSLHWRGPWLEREIRKERYPVEYLDGIRYYTAHRLDILTDPTAVAQYAFVRDFRELIDSGGLKTVYDDELTFLFECDYPAYLETHQNVDLEILGLE